MQASRASGGECGRTQELGYLKSGAGLGRALFQPRGQPRCQAHACLVTRSDPGTRGAPAALAAGTRSCSNSEEVVPAEERAPATSRPDLRSWAPAIPLLVELEGPPRVYVFADSRLC